MAEPTRDWLARSLVGLLCCEPGDVVDAATLERLGADSLDPIEMSMAIEDQFRVKLADDEIGVATTVGELIALIDTKVAAR